MFVYMCWDRGHGNYLSLPGWLVGWLVGLLCCFWWPLAGPLSVHRLRQGWMDGWMDGQMDRFGRLTCTHMYTDVHTYTLPPLHAVRT